MKKIHFIFLILLAVGCRNDNIQWIGQFSNGLAAIKINGKHGYIDTTGKVKIPCNYSYASEFTEGFARVQINGKYGFIDTTGKYLFEPNYDNVFIFENGHSTVDSSGLEAIINTKGEFVTKFQKNEWVYCENGIVKIEKPEGIIFYNINTEKQIGKIYQNANRFENGLAAVMLENKWGFINNKGKLVIPAIYDYVGNHSEGLIKVAKAQKIGFIDSSGATIIPFNLDFRDQTDFSTGFNSFSNGLCIYTENKNKKGYINSKGQVMITAKYDNCYPFDKRGLAMISLNKKWGVIDTKGVEIIKPEYTYIWFGDKNLFKVQKNDKFGFVNERNELIVDLIYDNVSTPYKGKAVVSKEGELNIINLTN